MNGKWHVHFGDAQSPVRSEDLGTKEIALARAQALKNDPSGPVFRFISRPDSMIVPEPEVATWCARNAR